MTYRQGFFSGCGHLHPGAARQQFSTGQIEAGLVHSHARALYSVSLAQAGE